MSEKIRIIEHDGRIALQVPSSMGSSQIVKFVDENKDKIKAAKQALKKRESRDKKVK